MKSLVSVALILSLTVPGFAQFSPPPCTPAPGKTVCSSPGAKNIWNGTSTYVLLIGAPVGIAGGLIVRHHYKHKAQQELKRIQELQNKSPNPGEQPASLTDCNNGSLDMWSKMECQQKQEAQKSKTAK